MKLGKSNGKAYKSKYHVSYYQECAVYEPAEGGYYVPVTQLDFTSSPVPFFRAMAEALQMVCEEELTQLTPRLWRHDSCYVGGGIYLAIERPWEKGKLATTYEGYC